MPLHIAGREDEQGMISKALRLITKPRKDGILERSPMTPIKIIGPRGAGKSALLDWTEQEAEKQGIFAIRCDQLKKGEGLANLIIPMIDKYRTDKVFFENLGIPDLVSYKDSSQGDITRLYHLILQAVLERAPVALLLDETMYYDPDSLVTVLHESQDMISRSLPFTLIFTGTPYLDACLSKLEVGFINRAAELLIKQISDEAVCEALREPFNKRGFKVADDALELMASWTENYPHFIQLAGGAVWDAMRAAELSEVDLGLVKKAKEVMHKRRNDFYYEAYNAIWRDELLSHARLVVDLVEQAPEQLAPEQVEQTLEERSAKRHGEEKVDYKQVLDLLQDHGLVWITDNRRVQAAIPSFFTYLKSKYKLNEGQAVPNLVSLSN